ncbi:hypothetical protein CKN63_13470 [Carnobacterium divergens]|uniref:helix-turn-helix domain-containing protein n=1 Tax=Carnobacterium divergens TaxID=2748 RepID=UPI0010724183|nr:helix-turn-helix domain-containing protein [Carnobacterium divergens]TFI60568.1 hypothetical protein CKN59_13405 [Carnobacterium divergens]TFI61633.1 hypothetical protein CKN76_12580 [Carnobacterium divergens]TFJ01043.1 hypothetical protein CKN75_12995 [Carnobacterium divergens]TFJ08963.1 hypothetical protein CKN71_13010 [Carnobacterium divergens]TFJ15672.1 hypothetical protein CKN63_13470 [Carnobacterium divergens]
MVEKYELNDPRIMTFSEASKKLGKNESYLRIMLNNHPQNFLKGTYRKFGKTYLITEEGIEYVQKIERKK